MIEIQCKLCARSSPPPPPPPPHNIIICGFQWIWVNSNSDLIAVKNAVNSHVS